MRISYDKGMEKIALAMEEYGHELFPSEQMAECDAILCTDLRTKVNAGQNGALYIMPEDKNPEQIQDILSQRLYEKLF